MAVVSEVQPIIHHGALVAIVIADQAIIPDDVPADAYVRAIAATGN